MNCGTPSSLSNGQRRYSHTTFGYTVTYTCNSGYLRTAGSSSRTCQSNGQWSGSRPTCTRKSTLCHSIFFTYRLLTYETIVYIYIYIYMYYNSRKLIVWYFVWYGVHVFVFMLSYFFFFFLHIINLGLYSLLTLNFGQSMYV